MKLKLELEFAIQVLKSLDRLDEFILMYESFSKS